MQKRSIGPVWKVALAVVAVLATALALYVQLFERRSRQEEHRLAAARLDDALAQSRARLKAEILAELRAELARGEPTGQQGDRPLPNTVLRRRESGAGSALQQVGGSPEATLAGLQESLDALARQMERSDQALRRDLEEIRAGARREQEVSSTVLSLLLVALVPLVVLLLASLWPPPGEPRQDADSGQRS